MRVTTAVMALVLISMGCRGDGGGSSGTDAPPNNDGVPPGGLTIMSLQDGTVPTDSIVELEGVVVTAIDNYGDRTGSMWVQDPAGGEYSGILVFGADLNVLASLSPGDLVDISNAQVVEFALAEDTSGRTTTELVNPEGGAMTVTKTGVGTLPAPVVLNPWDLAASDAESEKWEGVLVRFNNVATVSDFRQIGDDATFNEVRITGPYRIQSALTQIDNTLDVGHCFESVTGIVDYFFDFKVLPRSAADLGATGSSCPQPEADATCGDTIDNDYNGFADCQDFGCQGTTACDYGPATVVNVHDGTVEQGLSVSITGAVITALDSKNGNPAKHFWIQDSGVNTAHNGLYVYRGGAAADLDGGYTPGAVVNVSGLVDEFRGVTQISGSPNVTVTTTLPGGSAVVTPITTGVSPGVLSDLLTGAPYTGAYVQLSGVEILTAPDNFGEFFIGVDSTNQVKVDDDLLDATVTVGQSCDVSGLLMDSFNQDQWELWATSISGCTL